MKKEWNFQELNNIKLYKFVFPLLLMIEFVYHKLNIVFVRSLKEEEESIVKDDELLWYYTIVANEDEYKLHNYSSIAARQRDVNEVKEVTWNIYVQNLQ